MKFNELKLFGMKTMERDLLCILDNHLCKSISKKNKDGVIDLTFEYECGSIRALMHTVTTSQIRYDTRGHDTKKWFLELYAIANLVWNENVELSYLRMVDEMRLTGRHDEALPYARLYREIKETTQMKESIIGLFARNDWSIPHYVSWNEETNEIVACISKTETRQMRVVVPKALSEKIQSYIKKREFGTKRFNVFTLDLKQETFK